VIVWLVACAREPVVTDLPPSAPGLVLLATQHDTLVTVDGTVEADTLSVDVDLGLADHGDLVPFPDDREGFRWQVLDAGGDLLAERTIRGPLIVREFLKFYSGQTGVDLLSAFPKLGTFPVQVPWIDGADRVEFQLRDDSGEYQPAGEFAFADADALDQGVSQAVVGDSVLVGDGAENRLDVVLVPDGYTADRMEQWAADADALAAELITTEPFATFAPYVTIRRIDVSSPEAGASFDCDDCGVKQTAFGSIFPVTAINRLTGSDYSDRSLIQLEQWEVARAASAVPWDVAIVVVDSPKYGGFAIHFATVTTAGGIGADRWTATGVHEFAHAYGLVGDEYTGDVCIRSDSLGLPVNITDQGDDPPWAAWVAPGTPLPTDGADSDAVGTWSHAYNCDELFRPAQECKMRNSAQDPFCPVCAETMVRRLFKFADPEAGVGDVEVHWYSGRHEVKTAEKADREELKIVTPYVREGFEDLEDWEIVP
jgi:hypothetical protein